MQVHKSQYVLGLEKYSLNNLTEVSVQCWKLMTIACSKSAEIIEGGAPTYATSASFPAALKVGSLV